MPTASRRRMPTFAQLLSRFGATDADVSIVSLSACLPSGDDPRHVLAYLRGLGCAVTSLDTLLHTVNTLDGEEELGAFATLTDDGLPAVLVSIASHGTFVLFRP